MRDGSALYAAVIWPQLGALKVDLFAGSFGVSPQFGPYFSFSCSMLGFTSARRSCSARAANCSLMRRSRAVCWRVLSASSSQASKISLTVGSQLFLAGNPLTGCVTSVIICSEYLASVAEIAATYVSGSLASPVR